MITERHELIHYETDLPLRFYINKLSGYESKHWHSSCEILFILSGLLTVSVDNVIYNLFEEDIIVINSDAIHDLSSDACEMILLQMDLESINFNSVNNDAYYLCCSVDKRNSYADYNYIRYLIARIILTNSDTQNDYKTMALIYTLLSELNTSFSETRTKSFGSDKYMDRIRTITRYIKRHYRENITLSALAENQHLSVSYLSKFFEKHMGTNFINYYNSIKLERAVNEMLSSDATIENIARNSGFSDSRSFVNAFKKNYGILPSEYRKNFKKGTSTSSQAVLTPACWTSINLNDTAKLEKLGKYLQLFQPEIPVSDYKLKTFDCGNIDFNASVSELQHTYRNVITVNSAKLLLLASVQEMVRKAQQEIGFKYISFNGLLSDDMMVYTETIDNKISLSFKYIDDILDFIVGLNLKPFIRLNFMPHLLAETTDKTVFIKKNVISKPKDLDIWKNLVSELFRNLINRYGAKTVTTWPINIWNEPATSVFGFNCDEDFFLFYTQTYKTIKKVLPTAKIGTPGMSFTNDTWFLRFVNYIEVNDCPPDYIDLHYYDDGVASLKKIDESVNKQLYFNNLSQYGILNNLNTDPNSFFLYLNEFKKSMKNMGYSKIPHYLTEWNLTLSNRNRINDTCFKSCYLAKNILENYDRLDSFAYWNLTDHNEEQQISTCLYHGGFGLLTMNGIPKASYNVYRLMKRLGNTFLGRGDGWFATKQGQKIIIIYYNYEHFSQLFSSGKLFDMIDTDRYIPFTNKQDAIAKVHLSNLPGTKCTIKEFFVNRNNGSSFDTWIRMGAEYMSKDDVEYLHSNSREGLYIHTEEILGGHLTISSVLEPLEVRLIEIEVME